jgi:hypothetical protein
MDNPALKLYLNINSNGKLMEKQSTLLTSTLKTPMTTTAVQQRIQEMASGTTPHYYDALRLAFGKTVNAIKQKMIVDELEKAREEYASRPELECRECRKVQKIEQSMRTGRKCGCMFGQLRCSGCHEIWKRDVICHGCNKAFK